jgi:protein O-GlcNAcase/histone acetyltransferase
LDIHYSNDAELRHLQARVEQMLGLGCEHFSLLFDDIPDRLDTQDIKRYGSLASAQCHVANALFTSIRDRKPGVRFVFCPTAYCGRMADAGLGGEGYLATLGRELLPEIDVFWTGPDIVSREITVAHVRELQAVLQRKPVIWDNLHANDYDARRFFCGPYSGRPRELRSEVSGLLSNPNNEFPLNYVPLRTLAEFVRCEGPWDARHAYLAAMREWLASFATIGPPIALEQLILFGDCYYLPHEEGPEAEALYERARGLLARDPAEWGDDAEIFRGHAARLQAFCERVTALRRRPLFHALYRRVSELRHELDLVERRVGFTSSGGHQEVPCDRGMAARLHRLLG